ncbi:MAG: hypothetical protein KBT09_04300 [Bacteroidales bacterium]|nr:hypothetical protein [Candidatus Sodaliphilus fimicaballi]
MEKEQLYQLLRDDIVRCVGFEMKTPRDFDALATEIDKVTHVRLSSHTLKRFWGYLKSVEVRCSTLDTLARFVGYTSWEGYVNVREENIDGGSHMSMSAVLDVTTIEAGTRLRLMWRPDRCVVVRYEGHGLFVVEDNVNSKLRFGDTFRCFRIVAHEPLVLTELRRPGMAQCSYICGERGGVIYDILK